ncbi:MULTISPECIES: hypothetical protein [Bradyrhizobium]|jgi:hypothetical protein|uniref:Blr5915 protein n=2 Tax=Bradyrhizobium diazoefficiens TaxID=1355477 RepID=Q89HS5_BRADU|nr:MULTISPECIES: hypothetical protein [Bradyrhizobium]AWO92810.1 hypothetical protein DI395_32760 [Bradyrhizobium diazoefficiens]QBP24684.1 hypothetical protein Bdiaspc4_31225 [Bradyrhizobium diazoefficiens]QHP69100.1 hypothetical protein EI171_18570 [Bradyrhizobium sp. LCT2]QLD42345.1 hypothetical protein HUW42_15695 [Bradyrhizobium diazoefficiens]WLB36088.1 hypothetical protein QIH78_32100 [Bradyrhizobium diazoefficiens]
MFTDADMDRADWDFLQNGAVTLFWNPAVLGAAKEDLRQLGYEVAEVACDNGLPNFLMQLSEVLHWREQFGYGPWRGNLDALNDGFGEYPFANTGRSVLALEGFHGLVSIDRDFAHGVLDIIESRARYHLLLGKVLICLVQTDDNRYYCAPIGCRSANWNRREWLHAARGL